jgi:hypothetical protein
MFSFTYTVNPDGTWTSDVTSTGITGTVTAGPRSTPTKQTFTITGFPTVTGQISNNGSTLTLATLTPTIETITYSNGDVVKRICHRSRILINLK